VQGSAGRLEIIAVILDLKLLLHQYNVCWCAPEPETIHVTLSAATAAAVDILLLRTIRCPTYVVSYSSLYKNFVETRPDDHCSAAIQSR
jgi:hypothetical protein